jgi:hypothetical protein
MSYQPLADAPGEIALQPRSVSTHPTPQDGEDDLNYGISEQPSSGIDMYVYIKLLFRRDPMKCSRTRPFPVDPDVPDETHQFTFRAVLVGCLLGSIGMRTTI